ncbi:MAG: Gx transporter family protein [Candidatus Atribacteria bacterium]|nr:Gx transporter family protein [Candidatus Atribacteria bacterium]MCD6349919.1 Gx transporter family protein [Candidatus Atribacteria bacterium]
MAKMKFWSGRKVIYLGLFTGIAIALHFLESNFPPLLPLPGVKVGLANIVTLFVFFVIGSREALLVLLVRILIGNLLRGTFLNIGFFLSLSGGIVGFLVLYLLSRKLRSVVGLSVASAVAHNLAQLSVAFLYVGNKAIFLYLPLLVFVGIFFGFFCGYAGAFLVSIWRQRFARS